MAQGSSVATFTQTPLAQNQVLSAPGRSLLKQLEGARLMPYDDQTGLAITQWVAGATIGVGHLIDQGEWHKFSSGITQQETEMLLAQDVAPFEREIRRVVTRTLSQSEFDALVIFAFNIGRRGFSGSSVVRLLNNPKASTGYASLESAWKAWNKSQGKVMQGLKNRRAAEWKLFDQGVYQ
ncbi:MAG: lysozyme [Alteromonadaceae bacterium]|nr:lysozyme [Alteromonadaceae bacterium]